MFAYAYMCHPNIHIHKLIEHMNMIDNDKKEFKVHI